MLQDKFLYSPFKGFGAVILIPVDLELLKTDPPENTIKFPVLSRKFINNTFDNRIAECAFI